MATKLASLFPLQQMITNQLSNARTKLAAAEEEKDEKKKDEKVSKLLSYEKKEHGHIPTPEEEKKEKTASAIDPSNPDEMEKLASALEHLGEKLASGGAYLGGESPQGGETISNNAVVGGKQNYQRGKATQKNQVPHEAPSMVASDNGGAKTKNEDTANKPPVPLSARYPKSGILKTAGSIQEMIAKAKEKGKKEEPKEEHEEEREESKESAASCSCNGKGTCEFCKMKEKRGSANMQYVLEKLGESKGGGMTLDSKAGEGPKPSDTPVGGNNARSHIESAAAAIAMKKVQGKEPQKKEMNKLLTEPMQSKSTDPVVQNNLRNAAKGGVKIAAVKQTLLTKIASDPNDPRYQKLQAEMKRMKGEKEGREKESMGTPPMDPGSVQSERMGT